MEYNPRLKAEIMQIVENQLNDSEIPETKETFDRLIKSGHSEQTAREMIGSVIVEDLYYMSKEKKEFDKNKYIEKLKKLE